MSVLGRLQSGMRAMFGPSQPVSDSDHWILKHIGIGSKAGPFVNENIALQMPAVLAAVSIISDSIAHIPVNVIRSGNDGETVIDNDHPVASVLKMRANSLMTSVHFFSVFCNHLLLWGNGYAEVQRDGAGRVVGLWPLQASQTRPDKIEQGRLVYKTSIDGKSLPIDGEDIVHAKGFCLNGYEGISPIGAAREAIGLGLAMQEFGAKFFANDAKSGGFLKHPGKMSDKARENLLKSFGDQGGLGNAHRTKILEEGLEFIPTTIPPEDAQFLSSREFQISEIARIYRVPLVLLQSHEKSTSWGSGIEQLIIAFVTMTLTPWVTKIEKELQVKLFTAEELRAGYAVKFNLNALLRGDMAARAGFYNGLFNIGAISPNEIRKKEDMPPYPGGDEYRVPLNMEASGSEGRNA